MGEREAEDGVAGQVHDAEAARAEASSRVEAERHQERAVERHLPEPDGERLVRAAEGHRERAWRERRMAIAEQHERVQGGEREAEEARVSVQIEGGRGAGPSLAEPRGERQAEQHRDGEEAVGDDTGRAREVPPGLRSGLGHRARDGGRDVGQREDREGGADHEAEDHEGEGGEVQVGRGVVRRRRGHEGLQVCCANRRLRTTAPSSRTTSAESPEASMKESPCSLPESRTRLAIVSATRALGPRTVTVRTSVRAHRPVRGSTRWCCSTPPRRHRR